MYIAIDGGGTKTEYLLLDKHFQVVDHYLGGCLNHDLLGNGWADVSLALKASIDVLLERNGLTVSDIEADCDANVSQGLRKPDFKGC